MNLFMLRETLGMASRSLVANRLRSILALLGIVIGVATLIGMVALINGFQRSFQRSIQSFGSNTIYIRRIRPGVMLGGDVPDSLKQRRAFTMDDAEAILAQCPSVRAIAPFKWTFQDLKLSNRGRTTRSTFAKHFPVSEDAPIWFPKRGELFLDAVATSPEESDRAQQQIIEVLRIRRHLPSNKANNFVVFTDDAFLSLYNAITGGVFALMALVSFVSLFVGGIGIMNIMLVAVTERTREIGVRKALGAPRKAILTQFMIEAVVPTGTRGVIGILLGAGISWAIHAASKMPTFVSLWSVIVGLVVSAVVGVFFGLFPAMRASRLDPVDSLRYE